MICFWTELISYFVPRNTRPQRCSKAISGYTCVNPVYCNSGYKPVGSGCCFCALKMHACMHTCMYEPAEHFWDAQPWLPSCLWCLWHHRRRLQYAGSFVWYQHRSRGFCKSSSTSVFKIIWRSCKSLCMTMPVKLSAWTISKSSLCSKHEYFIYAEFQNWKLVHWHYRSSTMPSGRPER